MIDEHRLLLSPIRPALSADLGDDSLSNLSGEWWPLEAFAVLAATRAG
jgi:hypothetical protein